MPNQAHLFFYTENNQNNDNSYNKLLTVDKYSSNLLIEILSLLLHILKKMDDSKMTSCIYAFAETGPGFMFIIYCPFFPFFPSFVLLALLLLTFWSVYIPH